MAAARGKPYRAGHPPRRSARQALAPRSPGQGGRANAIGRAQMTQVLESAEKWPQLAESLTELATRLDDPLDKLWPLDRLAKVVARMRSAELRGRKSSNPLRKGRSSRKALPSWPPASTIRSTSSGPSIAWPRWSSE